MATLQNIRNRAGILVAIIIGLALVAFILGDILNAGSSLLRPSRMEVADINGTSVQYPEFQQRIDQTAEIYKMNTGQTQLDDKAWAQVREQVWQDLVQENIMGDVYDNLGLTVSSDELFDMVQGSNIHPIVRQIFTNPQTGQFDKSFVLQFLKALDTQVSPERKAYWLYLENQIKKDRIMSKYNNLVRQGLYVTTTEAQSELSDQNKTANIQYIVLPYSSVADSAVTVTEQELKNYYKAHLKDYKQEKSRTVEYVTFPVVASKDDDTNTMKWIEDIKKEFASIEDNEPYVNVNSDIRFENVYMKKDDISPGELAEFAFDGKVGDMFGSFKEGETYKLAKIDDIRNLPDSVAARHILIRPETVGSYEKAIALADSLKLLIEKGTNFADLAKLYSEDTGSAAKGGDLAWFRRNQMVKPFEEAVFNGEVNKLYVVTSQFGVHLVQPTKRGKEVKQVRLAILTRNVEPSTQTYQNVYARASKFASESHTGDAFKNSVKEQNLSKKIAHLGENDLQVTGLDQSRSLVRAAYSANRNDVLKSNEGSTIFEFGDNFVVAVLSAVKDEGTASFQDVKLRAELAVKKEKKAQLLMDKMKNAATGTDMEAIATTLNTEVKDANSINFGIYTIPGLGVEPAVTGTAASLEKDRVSSPVKGNTGVYLVKVISSAENPGQDLLAEQQRLRQAMDYRVNFQAVDAQIKAAEIEDKRSKFY